ncbi:hypothetical protein Tco_1238187, partial [Tanacetum coccineum]
VSCMVAADDGIEASAVVCLRHPLKAQKESFEVHPSCNLKFLPSPSLCFVVLYQGIEKQTTKLQGSDEEVAARHECGLAVIGTDISTFLEGQLRVEARHI